MGKPSRKKIKIQGEIIPCDWNRHGKPVAVLLDTDDESYTLAKNQVHADLVKIIGSFMELTGTISTGPFGENMLTVTAHCPAETRAGALLYRVENGVE